MALSALLAVACSGAYAVLQPASARTAIVLVLSGVCCMVAMVAGWRQPTGVLRWDGGHWFWLSEHGNRAVNHLQIAADFQSLILLRLQLPGQVLWLWLEPTPAAHTWRRLRCALVAARGGNAREAIEPAKAEGA